jgi:GT2 family glycosyltransferase
MDALVITPVKNSLNTTQKTIEAIFKARGDFEHIVYNDFSNPETRQFLENNQERWNYRLFNLEEFTQTPSPNYKIVLQMAQALALTKKVPLILVESDVIINENTIIDLIAIIPFLKKPGLIGMITVDAEGNYNFPYGYILNNNKESLETFRSLSFCCTLMSHEFLLKYDFKSLSSGKDWFDIYISRRSRKLGFHNYLIKKNGVLHLPHSSRPWKQLKYTDPLKYYFFKLIKRRDRI